MLRWPKTDSRTSMESRGSSRGGVDIGLQDLVGAGLEYLSAEHELQCRQIMFGLLLKQFHAVRLNEARYASVIQVVEPAIPPVQKASPHRVLLVL